jgi:Ala-tRNA(Pro) deacylase
MAADQTGGQIERTTAYLDGEGVRYEVVDHETGFTAAEEARASGVEPQNAAKSILLRDDGGYRLVVIQASDRLDLAKVRDLLEEGKELRLASEQEMGGDFPQFELGAIPPLGPMLPAPEVVDRRLLDHERVLCNGGDHRHSLLIDPRELVRATGAQVADLVED